MSSSIKELQEARNNSLLYSRIFGTFLNKIGAKLCSNVDVIWNRNTNSPQLVMNFSTLTKLFQYDVYLLRYNLKTKELLFDRSAIVYAKAFAKFRIGKAMTKYRFIDVDLDDIQKI